MAAGGDVAGSDAVFDHVCDPCSDEHTVGAVGFCVDCEEWLCQDCFRTHRKPKPLRNHVLMTEEEMKNSTQTFKTVDKCSEKCEQHGGKRIKYFCKDHNFLGCSTCFLESHRSCKIDKISDSSSDSATKSELQQVTTDLNEVVKQSKEIVANASDKIALVKRNKIETVEEFRKYKNEMIYSLDEVIEFLEKVEVDIENKCRDKEEKEVKRLEQIIDKQETIEKESLFIQYQLDTFEDRGQLCNMFVVMKNSQSKIETMKDDVEHFKVSTGISLYEFKPTVQAGEIVASLKGIGELVETRHMASEVDYSAFQFQHVTDILVKTEGNKTCRITGSALIEGNKLVLIDHINRCVKVVDTHQNKLLSQFKVNDGAPWGICTVSDNSVAVTIHNKHKLLFLTVDATGKVSTLKSVAVSGECMSVAVVGERLIVGYKSPSKVEIMDMVGSVLQTFGDKNRGRAILNTPQYISVSPDKKSLYVSNTQSNMVTCMSLDGIVTATYTDDGLKDPEQTAVDSNGMIYVSGFSTKNVHLISPDCKKIKNVLSESDGLKFVLALSYCENSKRLYIGLHQCDVIKVFQLA